VGCGALRIRPGAFGELKRIFVDPRARGVRLGHRIAQRLEQHVIEQSLPKLYLEPESTSPKRWRCSELRALSSASRLAITHLIHSVSSCRRNSAKNKDDAIRTASSLSVQRNELQRPMFRVRMKNLR
jgi:hypothetical protein